MKMNIEVEMPNNLLADLLQHLRDFEAPRSKLVHMKIGVVAPDMTITEASAAFDKVKPPYSFRHIDINFDGKTGICANPACQNPYFHKKRKTQKYCEEGPCAQNAQREHKRRWWARNREKG